MENRVSPEEGGEAKLLLESTAPMAMMDSGPESRRCQASTGSYPACYRVKVQGPSSQIKIPSACSFGASSPQLLKSAKGPARLAAGAGGRTAAVRPRQQTPCCVAPPDGYGNTSNCPLAPTAWSTHRHACPILDHGGARAVRSGSLARGATYWPSSSSSRSPDPVPPSTRDKTVVSLLVGFE